MISRRLNKHLKTDSEPAIDLRSIMGGEGVYCSSCGITLRAFMNVCPRCGALRDDATPLAIDQTQAAVEPKNKVITLTPNTESTRKNREQNLVFLPPVETRRRFPVFTAGQWLLIAAGIGLMFLMSVIAFLLWRQQKREWQNLENRPVVTTPGAIATSPSPNTNPSPSPTPPPVDDQAITAAVKSTLLAY